MSNGIFLPTQLISISILESSGFLSAVGRLQRLWDNGIEVRQDFWRKTISRYTKQPIKKRIFYSSSPESLQATNRRQKSLRTQGSRLNKCRNRCEIEMNSHDLLGKWPIVPRVVEKGAL